MKIWSRFFAFLLVLMVVFTITPMQVYAEDIDDLDDLPPLIPSGKSNNMNDLDDLPPLIPKTPEGKNPPSKPPIEIEVPEDGDDLDLDLSDDDMRKLMDDLLGVWTISMNDTDVVGFTLIPGEDFIFHINFVAQKSGESMYGSYTTPEVYFTYFRGDEHFQDESSWYDGSNSFDLHEPEYYLNLENPYTRELDIEDPRVLWQLLGYGRVYFAFDPMMQFSGHLFVYDNGRVEIYSPHGQGERAFIFKGTFSKKIEGSKLA